MTSLDLQSNTTKVSSHTGYRITSRDLDILVAIYRFRFLTRQLVEWAFFSRSDGDFDTRSSLAARRLQALYQAGYAQRLVLPMLPGAGRAPLVYALSSRGADAVASRLGVDRAGIDWLPRHNRTTSFFMEHTLAIARLWASLTAALRGNDVKMATWIGESELRQRKTRVWDNEAGRMVPLRPDGYVEFVWPDNSFRSYFVEIDMGTETNARVAQKMRAYERYGREGFEADYGLRYLGVLVVTSGRRRLDNLRRVTDRATPSVEALFGTLASLHPGRVLDDWKDTEGDSECLIGS